jgi:hypothetical protein
MKNKFKNYLITILGLTLLLDALIVSAIPNILGVAISIINTIGIAIIVIFTILFIEKNVTDKYEDYINKEQKATEQRIKEFFKKNSPNSLVILILITLSISLQSCQSCSESGKLTIKRELEAKVDTVKPIATMAKMFYLVDDIESGISYKIESYNIHNIGDTVHLIYSHRPPVLARKLEKRDVLQDFAVGVVLDKELTFK